MVSASTPSANEPSKDLILVHTVQLNQMIKAPISRRIASGGISDIALASVQNPSEEVDDYDNYYDTSK